MFYILSTKKNKRMKLNYLNPIFFICFINFTVLVGCGNKKNIPDTNNSKKEINPSNPNQAINQKSSAELIKEELNKLPNDKKEIISKLAITDPDFITILGAIDLDKLVQSESILPKFVNNSRAKYIIKTISEGSIDEIKMLSNIGVDYNAPDINTIIKELFKFRTKYTNLSTVLNGINIEPYYCLQFDAFYNSIIPHMGIIKLDETKPTEWQEYLKTMLEIYVENQNARNIYAFVELLKLPANKLQLAREEISEKRKEKKSSLNYKEIADIINAI